MGLTRCLLSCGLLMRTKTCREDENAVSVFLDRNNCYAYFQLKLKGQSCVLWAASDRQLHNMSALGQYTFLVVDAGIMCFHQRLFSMGVPECTVLSVCLSVCLFVHTFVCLYCLCLICVHAKVEDSS